MQKSVSMSPHGKVVGVGCSDRSGAGVPIHSPAPFRQDLIPFYFPTRNREGGDVGRLAGATNGDGVPCSPEPRCRSRRQGKRAGRVARQASSAVTGLLALALLVLSGDASLAGQLPPEAQADRYLLQAEDWIRQQDFTAAKGALDRIVELQEEHGLTIPDAFWYRHAEVSQRVGLQEEAIESATRYVTLAGRAGEHYVDALRLLNVIEEARRRAEAVVAGMEFVRVPAGEFLMGSTSDEADDNEQPLTRVRISRAFELGKHEVRQAEWEAVMGSNPSRFDECGPDCPAERVSWDDVQEFIGRLNALEGEVRYRLPTEAEWEYAARAGTSGDRYGGDLDAIAWYGENSESRTHPVGQKVPNAFGLHDMLGNVYEWVQDWYGAYPGGSVTDPQGPMSGSARLGRGGGWIGLARRCRASHRDDDAPGLRLDDLGFRLLRIVP